MRTGLWIGLTVVVVIALVVVGLTAGWALWGRQLWHTGMFGVVPARADCGGWGYGMGPGMMGGTSSPGAPCPGQGYGTGPEGTGASLGVLTIAKAHEAVERYAGTLGYRNPEVSEVMEFERNFYAIVQESDTGIGAMELLVDKWTGQVGPEMGPNMMWNARYGMHGRGGRIMGRTSETNALSPEEVLGIAQRWLDTYRDGVSVEEHADPFYGYYTIHTALDGQIEGMLSVHGTTGQVWYHNWHGPFIQMVEEEEGH